MSEIPVYNTTQLGWLLQDELAILEQMWRKTLLSSNPPVQIDLAARQLFQIRAKMAKKQVEGETNA